MKLILSLYLFLSDKVSKVFFEKKDSKTFRSFSFGVLFLLWKDFSFPPLSQIRKKEKAKSGCVNKQTNEGNNQKKDQGPML